MRASRRHRVDVLNVLEIGVRDQFHRRWLRDVLVHLVRRGRQARAPQLLRERPRHFRVLRPRDHGRRDDIPLPLDVRGISPVATLTADC